jgi:putative flippase GtrA
MDYQLLKKQIPKFLVAGFSGVAVDLTVYSLLLKIISVSPAKATSFVCGTCVSFVINKYWTYQLRDQVMKHAAKFAALYAFSLVINVSINKFTLLVLPHQLVVAFIAAASVTTVINFTGQKLWVFK